MENPQQIQTPVTQENIVSQTNKNPSLPILLSGVALVSAIVAGGVGYYLGSMQKSQTVFPDQEVQVSTTPQTNQTACSMEAKLCPDGSSVGRSGPNCEFAACPSYESLVLPDGWVKQGPQITSVEGCYSIQIANIGPVDDIDYYVAETYPTLNNFESSKYFLNKYKTIAVPSMGIGEVEKVYVDLDGNVFELSINYSGKGEGSSPTVSENLVCEQRKTELPTVINSIDLGALE